MQSYSQISYQLILNKRPNQLIQIFTQCYFTYNISNFFRATSRMFHLHDEEPEPSVIDPFQFPSPVVHPPENPQADDGMQLMYYQQYKKIYHTSYRLSSEAAKQVSKHHQLTHKIAQIEAQMLSFERRKRSQEMEEIVERTPQNARRKERKRNRRTAQEIVRRYQCPHQYCDRCYGSEGSLQQHIKLKHPELYQKEESDEQS